MTISNIKSNILGLSFGYHDSNLSYITKDGCLISLQEERFSRIKFDKSFPSRSLEYLSNQNGFNPDDLTIVFYEDPNLKRIRQLKDLFLRGESSEISEDQLSSIIHTSRKNFSEIIYEKFKPYAKVKKIKFTTHHKSHAASTFFSSPFENAAVLVIDAVGEKISTSIWNGEINSLEMYWKQSYPNSLGLFYSSFSNYCGFSVNSGEFKFMGLSPYGLPLYVDDLYKNFISISENGEIKLNYKHIGLTPDDKFDHSAKEKLFGFPRRKLENDILQFHADIAKSVQLVLEKSILNLVRYSMKLTGKKQLCLAGGVALNCVANQKVSDLVGGDNLFIVPASGDSGTSLGSLAVGLVESNSLTNSKTPWRLNLNGAKLGRSFSKNEVLDILNENKIKYSSENRASQLTKIATLLAEGKIGAIFEGRSEFGPRALGNRSIIADPRIVNGQIDINLKIKLRESFRPFAPIVLEEDAAKYFEIDFPSPYMLVTTKVKNFSEIKDFKVSDKFKKIDILECLSSVVSPLPSITHLDGSARVQTIKSTEKCFIVDLLKAFKALTGCSVLVNTSFNVRGEPIVDTPFEALNCLATTSLDFLWIEDYIVLREDLIHFNSKQFSSKLLDD